MFHRVSCRDSMVRLRRRLVWLSSSSALPVSINLGTREEKEYLKKVPPL